MVENLLSSELKDQLVAFALERIDYFLLKKKLKNQKKDTASSGGHHGQFGH